MKKLIFIIFFLTITVVAVFADTVTPDMAQLCAEDFFNSRIPKTKAGTNNSVHLVWTFPDIQTKSSSSDPLLYVYERESGGYAIIAGEDAAHPILGYSLSEYFPANEMPENMKGMLAWYAESIGLARQKHWTPDSNIRSEWSGVESDGNDGGRIVKLETAKWNQWSPFNDLCPIIDGNRCPSGCVATAIAIIMRYHEWPRRGTGHLDSYGFRWNGTEYQYQIEGYDLGHEYKWEEMPTSRPAAGFTEEQSIQIAQLLHDIGVMVHMQYNIAGSSSSIHYAVGLAEHFGYDKNIEYAGRGGYSASRWEQIIKKEIDEDRPVLYCGDGYYGFEKQGHAFVIDGYCGRYFSINYGWGGSSTWRTGHDFDGELGHFFTLTPIDGHEEDLLVFNESQSMLYGIQPDTGKEHELSGWINKNPVILNWVFTSGTTFNVRTGFGLDIYDFDSFESIDVSIGLFDQDLKPKEIISEIYTIYKSDFSRSNTVNTISYNTFTLDIPCRINSSIQQGDRIQLCMLGKQGEWLPIMPLRRADYIEFSLRPLSELVSIGYTQDNPFPNESGSVYAWDYYNNESRSVFYIYGYKDLYWELKNSINNNIMRPSDRQHKSVYFDDSNVVHYFFNLPSGDYQLTIRNVKEEAIIYFSL